MSTEFADAAGAVEEVAVSAAKVAKQVVADPVGSARKQVRGFERRSARAARKINRRFARISSLRPETMNVWGLELNGAFPEKAAVKGLHLVRLQARRKDGMGEVAKSTLRVLHTSFRVIARVATRLEQATDVSAGAQTAVRGSVRKRAPRRRAVRRAA